MKNPVGWWLACPYFPPDAHILRMAGPGPGVPPDPGERTYLGAFLDEWWARYRDPRALIERVVSRLLPGSRLALWWKQGEGPAPRDIVATFATNGWTCIEDDEPRPGYLFQVYDWTGMAAAPYAPWRKADKSCLVLRFGGYGDHLMASSVLPHLKAEGWHITYCGTKQGLEVLRHDPHIDGLMRHNPNLVREDNGLADWLDAWAPRFDRVVNLNASIERACLYRADQHDYYRDDATRRRLVGGRNYLEYVHLVAGVPYEPRQRFWPSCNEADEAVRFAREHGPLVMLCLNGSSEYKLWPHAPRFAVQALARTGCTIALAGGEKDAELIDELFETLRKFAPHAMSRVLGLTGWDIRRTMALARECKAVIGPETGVMNAVAFEPEVWKIVMLSHSSAANLTRDWPATHTVVPDVPCHPCHRLHPDTSRCPRGPETGRAACAESIRPELIGDLLVECLARPARAPLEIVGDAAA
ncbi:MAG: glycosyltransferase family 9 protein [Hyphomicrobiaceae bacterium]